MARSVVTVGSERRQQKSRPTAGFVALVNELRDERGLTTAEVATLTGVRDRQVQHWVAGTSEPSTESLRRLVDVQYLMKELSEVFRPEGARIWLHSRLRRLGDRRPIDALVDGDFDLVLAEVRRLVDGND